MPSGDKWGDIPSLVEMKWIRRGPGSPFRVAPASPGRQPLGKVSFVPRATPMPACRLRGPEICLLVSLLATLSMGWSSGSSYRQGIPSVSYNVTQLRCGTQPPVAQNYVAPSTFGAFAPRGPRFPVTLGYPGKGPPSWQEHVQRLKEKDPTLMYLE